MSFINVNYEEFNVSKLLLESNNREQDRHVRGWNIFSIISLKSRSFLSFCTYVNNHAIETMLNETTENLYFIHLQSYSVRPPGNILILEQLR